jgi:SAM-dependent methyltransferase
MSQELFVKHLRQYTELFLVDNPDHPYKNNIQQYLNADHVNNLFDRYRNIIDNVRREGATSIIDVGSGIGFAKHIDPSITTANVNDTFFSEVEEVLDVVKDITLSDCTIVDRWVDTEDKFDCVILYRFMPWAGQTIENDIIIRIFAEMSRILKPNGILIYTPIGATQFNDRRWSEIEDGFTTFKLSQSDIHNELNKAKNKILQHSIVAID